MGRADRRRGSAHDGFNFRIGNTATIYAPTEGEGRKLLIRIDPQEQAMIARNPDLMGQLILANMREYVPKMEAEGWYLAEKPGVYMTRPSLDPAFAGWMDIIIPCRWKHHGPVGKVNRDFVESKKEEETRIGAGQLKNNAQEVARYVREHPNAVQREGF